MSSGFPTIPVQAPTAPPAGPKGPSPKASPRAHEAFDKHLDRELEPPRGRGHGARPVHAEAHAYGRQPGHHDRAAELPADAAPAAAPATAPADVAPLAAPAPPVDAATAAGVTDAAAPAATAAVAPGAPAPNPTVTDAPATPAPAGDGTTAQQPDATPAAPTTSTSPAAGSGPVWPETDPLPAAITTAPAPAPQDVAAGVPAPAPVAVTAAPAATDAAPASAPAGPGVTAPAPAATQPAAPPTDADAPAPAPVDPPPAAPIGDEYPAPGDSGSDGPRNRERAPGPPAHAAAWQHASPPAHAASPLAGNAAADAGQAATPAAPAASTPAAPAEPAQHRPGVLLTHAAETLRMTISAANAQGVSRARIALRPAELGGVEIALAHGPAGLSAIVTADSAQAAQALQRAADELQRSLAAQGLSLVSLQIGVAGEGPSSRRREDRGASADDHGASEAPATDEVAATRTIELPDGVLVDVLA